MSLWRDSATVICAAAGSSDKLLQPSGQLQYLVTKRSEAHPNLGGSLCFPGGLTSIHDTSPDWTDLFAEFGVNLKDLRFLSSSAHKPDIYLLDEGGRPVADSVYSMDIGLRITGLRELFEECGIFLCTSTSSTDHQVRSKLATGSYSIFSNEQELKHWQTQVRKHPLNLVALCRKFSVLPNLEALVEWSNWLTPAVFGSNRFNTVFYMAILPIAAPTVVDPREVAYAKWESASEIVSNQSIFVPAPQFYEMTRLQNTSNGQSLRTLMDLRLKLGLETWSPTYLFLEDGTMSCLPGDELYGTSSEDLAEVTLKSDQAPGNKSLHRILLTESMRPHTVQVTIEPRYGHWYSLRSKF